VTCLIVLAKEPRPGRVKTRLCPPLSPQGAAALAEAALVTTLDEVAQTAATRRVLALDGAPGHWLPGGFEVIGQRGAAHDERIANAFADCGEAALLIGMDSPQVTPALLDHGLRALADTDAVLGLAEDGGWWGMGLRRPDPDAVRGVPMSRPDTGQRQLSRLRLLGLDVATLAVLRDVDTIEDARHVAAAIPRSPFARTLARLEPEARGAA